jgi:hypothetical protein
MLLIAAKPIVDLLSWPWTYLEPIIGLTTLFLAFRIWMRSRSVRRRVRRAGIGGPPLIPNFSDHPLTSAQAGWTHGYTEYHWPLDLTLESPGDLERSLIQWVKTLPSDISARLRAADPNIVMVPPGATSGLLLLEPILHGLAGQFSRAAYWIRTENGYVLSPPVDRQRLRWRVRPHIVKETFGPAQNQDITEPRSSSSAE